MRTYDIMGKRNWFFAFSFLVILWGAIVGFTKGPNLDIDFRSGTIINMNMKTNQFNVNDIRVSVDEKVKDAKATVLIAGANKDQVSIRAGRALTTAESNEVISLVSTKYNLDPKADLISVDTIDPLISKEITQKGLYAVGISSLLILGYVAFMFNKMGGLIAGTSAIIALIHDILILLSFYIITQIPINSAFIAAALTILGYSMNDTIIVYDRIRENEKTLKKLTTAERVNESIIQTLSRTINTGLTTVIAIVILYVLGSMSNLNAITEFTLPMLVGIISGTYSSIFIASAIYVMWTERLERKEREARA